MIEKYSYSYTRTRIFLRIMYYIMIDNIIYPPRFCFVQLEVCHARRDSDKLAAEDRAAGVRQHGVRQRLDQDLEARSRL